MKYIKLFENDSSTTNTNGMGSVKSPQPSQVPGQVNQQLPSQQTPTDDKDKKNEDIITRFTDFLFEDGEGGGVASATMGNTNGMGSVISPTVSAIPGDVAGSTPGSGDLAAKTGTYTKTTSKKRRRKLKNFTEGVGTEKENMYITKFDEFSGVRKANEHIGTDEYSRRKTAQGDEEYLYKLKEVGDFFIEALEGEYKKSYNTDPDYYIAYNIKRIIGKEASEGDIEWVKNYIKEQL